MTNPTRALHKFWDSRQSRLSPESKNIPPQKFSELLANVFCPGPFYYYIFDFAQRSFSYVHPNVEKILGIPVEEYTVPRLIAQAHPEDFEHFMKCEERAGQFLFEMIQPQLMPKYKVSFCVRLRRADGSFGQFLHQAMALSVDEDLRLCQTIAVHSDITGLADFFSRKLSFISLDNIPSYHNLDPYTEDWKLEIAAQEPGLTPREAQIVRLLAEGLTAEQIAQELFISFNTVRTHRKNLLQKFNCKNAVQLVALSIRRGWI